ncbi:MAG TPA: XdhC family protein [Bacteroidia bacterium]|nr:XdhC family protein [Bacteroidia bacterium]
MKEIEIWKFIKTIIHKNKKAALLTVVESSDSSPGKQGFKMAVDEDGNIIGTIGGGIMEKNLISESLTYVKAREKYFIKTLYHNPESAKEKSGLICGGKQIVAISVFDYTDKIIVGKILSSLEAQSEVILSISQNGLSLNSKVNSVPRCTFIFENELNYEYKELYENSDTIYIIGGGHVGLAISKILANLDFYIIVIDQREDVITMRNNIYAHKKVISSYDEVGNYIKEGGMSYVVIVSPQHTGDEAALKSVINKNLKYLGMMGSKRKIKTIRDNLILSGIDPELLSKVHMPIGLEIGAQTPDEIAVSIAAEIIKVKYS